MNQEQTFLLEIWKKAFEQDEPLEVDCKTASSATQFRMALYNAAKPVKKSPGKYPGYAEAVENCMITLQEKGGEKRVVVVKQKMLTELMQSVAAQLDIPMPKARQEREIAEAAERLAGRVQSSPIGELGAAKPDGGRGNPYYKGDQ